MRHYSSTTNAAIASPARQEGAVMSDKIKPHHLARKALLYVRQSSTHQVLHNRESQALQYAMRDRLVALGWSEVDTWTTISGDPPRAA